MNDKINKTSTKHGKKIIVNCWSCGKAFDIVKAERCYAHLNLNHIGHVLSECVDLRWTTKCSHCGACVCHKYEKMKEIVCPTLNNVGIGAVMPSVYKQLEQEAQA